MNQLTKKFLLLILENRPNDYSSNVNAFISSSIQLPDVLQSDNLIDITCFNV